MVFDAHDRAHRGLDAAGLAPCAQLPAELIADKGYHSRAVLKDLADGPWRAVYGNRARQRSGVGKEGFALRAEKVERSFALTLDRGGLRRAWLGGRDNLQKRYFVHVAAYNLGLVMRQLVGAGTPKELATRGAGLLWLLHPDVGPLAILILPPKAPPDPTSSTGC